MIMVDNKFDLEEKVILKTDEERLVRLVTSIGIHPEERLLYGLTCAEGYSVHYDFEMEHITVEVI